MTHDDSAQAARPPAAQPRAHTSRRKFLALLPLGVGAAVAATLLTAAARFLRPQAATAAARPWLPVARLPELTGTQPLARSVSVQRVTGWTQEIETHAVFVLPQPQRILSAACPHEGCAVVWHAGEQQFLCPCHDSRFDATGARMGGPAARGLEQLPARVAGDTLEVQLQPAPGPAAGSTVRA